MKTFIACTCIFLNLFLFHFPHIVYGKVWINEFSSGTSDDWVELYNDSQAVILLDGMQLVDSSSKMKDLVGELPGNAFLTIDVSNRLNKSHDLIKLVSTGSETTVFDQVSYGSDGEISSPQSEQSAGRIINGGGVWGIFANASPGTSNAQSSLIATPTPEPEPTVTPTKQPTPTKTPTPTKQPTTKRALELEDEEPVEVITRAVASNKKTVAKKNMISGVPTAILGLGTPSAKTKAKAQIPGGPTQTVMVKNVGTTPFMFLSAGTIFCVSCAILVFLKRKIKRHE